MDIFLKEIFYIFIDVLLKWMSHLNFPDLLRSLYSLEISQNPLIIKTGTNTVKSEISKTPFNEKRQFFRNERRM